MVQYSCFCININGQASLYVICIYNNLEQFETFVQQRTIIYSKEIKGEKFPRLPY